MLSEQDRVTFKITSEYWRLLPYLVANKPGLDALLHLELYAVPRRHLHVLYSSRVRLCDRYAQHDHCVVW